MKNVSVTSTLRSWCWYPVSQCPISKEPKSYSILFLYYILYIVSNHLNIYWKILINLERYFFRCHVWLKKCRPQNARQNQHFGCREIAFNIRDNTFDFITPRGNSEQPPQYILKNIDKFRKIFFHVSCLVEKMQTAKRKTKSTFWLQWNCL